MTTQSFSEDNTDATNNYDPAEYNKDETNY